jgi:ferredoxin
MTLPGYCTVAVLDLRGHTVPGRAIPNRTTTRRPPTRLECLMPKLTVESYGTFDVADNKRLVLAIEQDAKVDILHACGGNARCTTCRVEFIDGEPSAMTTAEKERLEQKGLSGVRLSCQIVCDHDMSVRAISRLEGSGRPDPGRTPEDTIQPPPVWT